MKTTTKKKKKDEITKVQVPMRVELKIIGEKLARDSGLSSLQELMRFWIIQASNGKMSICENYMSEISPEKEAEYLKIIEETKKDLKAGKIRPAKSVKELMQRL